MYLFNKEQQLRKYETIYDIIDEFCPLEPLDPPPTGLLLCLSVSLFFPICAQIVS